MKKVWIASILTCIILMLPITNVVSASEIEKDCFECQPVNRIDIMKVKLFLFRTKAITNVILSTFGNIPEIQEKCQEISGKITTFQERIKDLKLILSSEENSIICGILFIIIIEWLLLATFFITFAEVYLKNFPKLYEIFATFVELIFISWIGNTLKFFNTKFDCGFFNPINKV